MRLQPDQFTTAEAVGRDAPAPLPGDVRDGQIGRLFPSARPDIMAFRREPRARSVGVFGLGSLAHFRRRRLPTPRVRRGADSLAAGSLHSPTFGKRNPTKRGGPERAMNFPATQRPRSGCPVLETARLSPCHGHRLSPLGRGLACSPPHPRPVRCAGCARPGRRPLARRRAIKEVCHP